jgi:2,3-bisphosphoglycerate-independent phosphoglycerate mutase
MLNKIKKRKGLVVLLIIDGWGIAPAAGGNALSRAEMPNYKELTRKYPAIVLNTAISLDAKAKIKAGIATDYLALGTGKLNYSKNNQSIFDHLDASGLKYSIICDQEKISYGTYFLNNKKKVKSGCFSIIHENYQNCYASYPELFGKKITNELLKAVKSGSEDFIVAIFSNLDIMAHCGDFKAAVAAAEFIDCQLRKIVKTVLDNSGTVLITSTHGNAEKTIEMQTELINRKDTSSPVPLIIVGKQFEGKSFGFPEAPGGDLSMVPPQGDLSNILPTILNILGLPSADNIESKSLIILKKTPT